MKSAGAPATPFAHGSSADGAASDALLPLGLLFSGASRDSTFRSPLPSLSNGLVRVVAPPARPLRAVAEDIAGMDVPEDALLGEPPGEFPAVQTAPGAATASGTVKEPVPVKARATETPGDGYSVRGVPVPLVASVIAPATPPLAEHLPIEVEAKPAPGGRTVEPSEAPYPATGHAPSPPIAEPVAPPVHAVTVPVGVATPTPRSDAELALDEHHEPSRKVAARWSGLISEATDEGSSAPSTRDLPQVVSPSPRVVPSKAWPGAPRLEPAPRHRDRTAKPDDVPRAPARATHPAPDVTPEPARLAAEPARTLELPQEGRQSRRASALATPTLATPTFATPTFAMGGAASSAPPQPPLSAPSAQSHAARRSVRIGTLRIHVAAAKTRASRQPSPPPAPRPPATPAPSPAPRAPRWVDPWHGDWFRFD